MEEKYYWAATNHGIALSDSLTGQFLHTYDFETGAISSKLLSCRQLLVDHDFNLWAASDRGFCKVNFRQQQFLNYDLTKFNLSGEIHSAVPDPDAKNNYYVTFWPGGIVRYDAGEQTIVNHWIQPHKPWQDSSTYIFSSLVDHTGRLWVGTDKGGICLFSPHKSYIVFADPENTSRYVTQMLYLKSMKTVITFSGW